MLWIANARPGEGALIMPLIAFDRITGTLETYIDALGRKSLALPNRTRLDLEPAPGAVMQIAAASPGMIDISADVITCEGWENGESINLVNSPAWRILALPGINTMKHLPSVLKPKERRVIAFQDSHPKGHPAHKGLEAGIDALIAAGKQVKVTAHSEHGDANSILQTEGLGEKELSRLIACAGSAALSFEGKVAELSKLPETEYMKARREVARTHKVPAGFLDREVAKRRPKPPKADYLSASKMPAAGVEGVVTNPPYRYAQRVAERALAEVPYVALLLRTNFRGPRALARSQRADARLLPPAAPADDAPGGLDG